MKLNEREMAIFASVGNCDRDGRMYYKILHPNSPTSRDGYKERWFRLKGNLLFYFKVNEYGGCCVKEPSGLLVIEDCKVTVEDTSPLPFSFSITFNAESDRKHLFSCSNQSSADGWVEILNNCSYETLRSKVADLRSQILSKTGRDPLIGFPHMARGGK